MLSIIWYLLLPQTFFPFTIPSRASFSRQFVHSQWPSLFIFLFLISSSVILPPPTLSSTTAFFILSVHFTLSILLHTHISNASSRFCLFRRSVQVSAPYNITLHTKHFTSLFRSSFSAITISMSSAHSPTFTVTSPTSQLILQTFRRFTDVTPHFPTLSLLHLRHSSFSNPSLELPTSHLIFQPAHSPSFPSLHLRHSSFSNPSLDLPTSQALHLCHLASRPCYSILCGLLNSNFCLAKAWMG